MPSSHQPSSRKQRALVKYAVTFMSYAGVLNSYGAGPYGWVSGLSSNNQYDTAAGGNWDYSGTESLGGISGEWLQVQLPEAVTLD